MILLAHAWKVGSSRCRVAGGDRGSSGLLSASADPGERRVLGVRRNEGDASGVDVRISLQEAPAEAEGFAPHPRAQATGACSLRLDPAKPSLPAVCTFPISPSGEAAELPEFIFEAGDAPPGRRPFWFRATSSSQAIERWRAVLGKAGSAPGAGCSRSVSIDGEATATEGARLVVFWEQDACPVEMRKAHGQPPRSYALWQERPFLARLAAGTDNVERVSLGKPSEWRDELSVRELFGSADSTFILVKQRHSYSAGAQVTDGEDARIYAASAGRPLALALGPVLSDSSSGNCAGGSTRRDIYRADLDQSPPDELVVRTTVERQVRTQDGCGPAAPQVTFKAHRFDAKSARYVPFAREALASAIEGQDPF
ncbi:hypothetical protein [Sorangium sp. So ce1151]|uniref:hypothetical protein n=1 Tax=Sorangium sp. So ce1151 TaxID=3133332 RepID=UPI003F647390